MSMIQQKTVNEHRTGVTNWCTLRDMLSRLEHSWTRTEFKDDLTNKLTQRFLYEVNVSDI